MIRFDVGYLQDDLDFIGTLALIQRSDKRVPVFKALKPIYPEKVYEENRPFVLAAIAFLNGIQLFSPILMITFYLDST
jgi:hypothetical protein